jgi:outer membrane protein assembly factor BamB
MKPVIYFRHVIMLSLITLFFSVALSAQEQNWTHFRGSDLSGISSTSKAPLKWSDSSSVKWKTTIHGKGWSSPVIYGNQIWVTSANPEGTELYAICADFNTGKLLHDIKVFAPLKQEGKHQINTYATPTPAIEKDFVYVHFGSAGTACIRTTDGKIMWNRTDLKCRHVQGPASSPVIYDNLLILHYEGTDVRFITALDKVTGETVWRTDRPEEPYLPLPEIGKKAYVTPLIIKVKGKDQLISNGSAVCIAYEPLTGKEIWRVVRGAESTVSMPFSGNGIVYFYTGFMVDADRTEFSEIVAVNPEGKGDITESGVIWKKRVERLQLLTPVVIDGLIYTVDTKNIMTCIDAADGKDVWTYRMRANHNASPVFAAGNLYFFSIRGETTVIEPGRQVKILAQNQLYGEIWATPAFLRNSMIIRTDTYLARIE